MVCPGVKYLPMRRAVNAPMSEPTLPGAVGQADERDGQVQAMTTDPVNTATLRRLSALDEAT